MIVKLQNQERGDDETEDKDKEINDEETGETENRVEGTNDGEGNY